MVIATRSQRKHNQQDIPIQNMFFKEDLKKKIKSTIQSKDLISTLLSLINKKNRMVADDIMNMALRKICISASDEEKKVVFINSFLPLLTSEFSFKRFELDREIVYVIPIFLSSIKHWRVVVIKEGIAYCYDSVKFNAKETELLRSQTLKMVLNVFEENTEINLKFLSGPQQDDATSCGLYVIAACELILAEISKENADCDCIFQKKSFRIYDEYLARINLCRFLIDMNDSAFDI